MALNLLPTLNSSSKESDNNSSTLSIIKKNNNTNNCSGSVENKNNMSLFSMNGIKKPLVPDLSLSETNYLKASTLNVPDLLLTPSIICSPIKSTSSTCLHVDDLNTPSLCLSSSTPNNYAQAFFGDHEPFTGRVVYSI